MLRVLFVAKVNRDRELDMLFELAASALRIRKNQVEATLEILFAQFDALLGRLVRDREVLYAVDVLVPSERQKTRLNEVWGAEYATARNFLVAEFGEEVRGCVNLNDLIDARVVQLRNGTA